ncbi:ABC transporter permease [Vogesella indigofera]|uniref:ABC transporter permease n=1 Tax=Vogesella indigofera TaxID=45465 RepID=UPI00234EF74F|nr:ABC transporter permease [Vogesella indigofera]MDC7700332.1 ABC transporter permease [Vogesella indigofera]
MRADIYHRSVVAMLILLLTVPVLATLLYSLSEHWGATILPDDLSLAWYLQLWQDSAFLAAFGRSLAVCLGTLLLSTLIIVPAVFVVFYRFPALDKLMNALILIPFAVPPVVTSVGLLNIYADGPLNITGTPWILVGCYFTIALPFMYRSLANSLSSINVRDLMDAAHLLGASTPVAFMLVILPNLRKGLMASLFLAFSFLLGDFVFANLLAGSHYETLQVYLYNMRQTSGHFTSAIVMSYFLFTLFLTWLTARFSK